MAVFQKASDTISESIDNASEVIKERLFSPMYFYFTLAWVITNWKFTYSLFFLEEENLGIRKIDYLTHFYRVVDFWGYLWNTFQLVLIPLFSAAVAVWWLSILSEKFYERNERHKMNQEVIRRKLDYERKIRLNKEQEKVRGTVYDENDIKYEDSEAFNEFVDDSEKEITVLGTPMRPSEVLYNTDYQAYVEHMNNWTEVQVDSYTSHLEEMGKGK